MNYKFTYDDKIIAKMEYDLFTGSTSGGDVEYELMAWLSALGGAWPLSSSGKSIKIVTAGDATFDLYQGVNGKTKVFSYVPKETTSSFTTDLKQFFDYLPSDNMIDPSQYLTHVLCSARTMKLAIAATVAALATTSASAQEFCGRDDLKVVSDYTVYNNLWGSDNDKTGKQCTQVDGNTGNEISWRTSFNWAGDTWQVKSFANAALKFNPVQLSSIASIPTKMEYTFTYDQGIISNVAYDLFTASSVGGKTENELMVWLAALGGAWPLTTTGKPIKSVTLGGVAFDLYQGWNNNTFSNTKVYSYVAKKTTTSFNADLKKFFDALPADNTIAPTQYLTHVQSGAEPFIGKNAKLTVSKYSAAVKTN
ncbi:hypothetical protein BBO99_00004150 [Phytophthora kernoviae]|uniref:Uncharacterized protein n=2 Tax=Phytophthora kernoviae TaxID=325452 RepID=A0A421FKH0_9STRA|nr:hypothetical protein G195_005714 [Phytophthora kernoviae 00238/432]KAG2523562.1 hypothetical protein JM18_004487 [Phytophthora kernoviae]KAG2526366.1 hypothetical protein JM16_003880 [Phytophthora kernoviae]RLN46326.1 hypothetical protein BBI17_004844 [Phytophthora kernoviae]RLN80893.1 hypothetical protein BBO99_00004150 [Phytophthora kernoviae]